MRLLIAIATTVALTSSAFAADLGPVPGHPQRHTTQRYAPVPDQDDNYGVVASVPQSAPTCPNQFSGGYGAYGAGAPTCAGAAFGSPCGAGYGYGAPYGYGYPVAYPIYAGGYGGYGFRGFGRHYGRH